MRGKKHTKNMSANFCPAGFEDSSDEDFSFGDGYNPGSVNSTETANADRNSRKTPAHSHRPPSNRPANNTGNRQGFGPPPAVKHSRRARSPPKSNHSITSNGSSTLPLTDQNMVNSQNCFSKTKAAPPIRVVERRARAPKPEPHAGRDVKVNAQASQVPGSSWLSPDAIPIDDFRMAVIRNNIDAVKGYLDGGVPVDTVFTTKWTALMYAAQNAQPDVVQLLLDRGADPNFNKDMYTVLMAACSSTCDQEQDILKCVELLLAEDADINAFDRHHMCALVYATRKLRTRVVEKLIAAGANLNKQDNKGYTALMCAAAQGHLRIMQVLLAAGADCNKQSCDGSKAADIAIVQGHSKAEELIRIKIDPMAVTDLTALDPEPATPESCVQTNGPSSSIKALQAAHSSQEIHRYGDLELFLSGLELSNLIPLIQEHHVTFQDLLRMRDAELQQLGITQMGVRKKILDASQDIHKKPWEQSSLKPVQYSKNITCADAIAMVTNIKQHVSYITSSVGHISDQIQVNKDILVNSQDGATSEELSIQTEEAITNIQCLFGELVSLRNHLTEVANRPDYKRADLIEPAKKAKAGGIISGRGLLACAALCGLAYYKSNAISTIFHRIWNKMT